MKPKLPPSTFDLPIQDLRNGYFADKYFRRTKRILESEGHNPQVLMQVFQKNDAVLCGVEEAIAVLRVATGYYRDPEKVAELSRDYRNIGRAIRIARYRAGLPKAGFGSQPKQELRELSGKQLDLEERLNDLWEDTFDTLTIETLKEGSDISPWETVMTIEGPYAYFADLETVYLGILARRTRVATNTERTVKAAGEKPVLFFPARFDHFSNQEGDGYAGLIAGAAGVSTDAQGEWSGKPGLGTIPHALIAAYGGDTAKATVAFARNYPDVSTVSLVDFDNDCVKTSLEVAEAMKNEGLTLSGVRLDTSGSMVDKSVFRQMSNFKPTGVCEPLVRNVRKALDGAGFKDVEIVVSGGFNPGKIKKFQKEGTPEDSYGVGSSMFNGNFDFTADIVIVESKPLAKVGRKYNPNPRLIRVEL